MRGRGVTAFRLALGHTGAHTCIYLMHRYKVPNTWTKIRFGVILFPLYSSLPVSYLFCSQRYNFVKKCLIWARKVDKGKRKRRFPSTCVLDFCKQSSDSSEGWVVKLYLKKNRDNNTSLLHFCCLNALWSERRLQSLRWWIPYLSQTLN